MRKAFECARLGLRLYVASGRIAFPLLLIIGYPLLFYYMLPVDVVSSFTMSAVAAFAWGAWVAIAACWAEDAIIMQLMAIKAGKSGYFLAQSALLALLGAAGGAFLVIAPVVARFTFIENMFIRTPCAPEIALGAALNMCAGVCGAGVGALCHPRLIRDRKFAYLLCLLVSALGFAGGMAGLPLAARALLPPLYDAMSGVGRLSEIGINALYCALWFIAYAAACAALRVALILKVKDL